VAHAAWTSTVEALLQRPWRAFQQVPLAPRLLLAACLLLSTVIVWGFRYQPGLDLPQHAHLFGLLANFHDAEVGVGAFYDFHLFTPYLLTYVVGTLLALLIGAIPATKALLFLIALTTPYTLLRWLRAIGGETAFAFWGFVLAFGYPYVWGFISFGAAMPVAFLCMEAWSLAPTGSAVRRVVTLAGLLVALFFTHAVTFLLVAVALGLSTLAQTRTAFWRRSFALLAPFLVSFGWFLARGASKNAPPHQAPDSTRFSLLFGGEFHIFEAYWAGIAGLITLVIMVIATRPVPTSRIERWLPAALSFVGFFSLPNVMMGTAFVGHRFVYLAHAFAPAAFTSSVQGRARRWVPIASGAVSVAFLITCLVRVWGVNRELSGLAQLSSKLPPGSDVVSRLPQSEDDSDWFGQDHLLNSPAWLTAENHGMVNDHTRFFQLPIARAAEVPFVAKYGYVVARGPKLAPDKRRKNDLKLIAEKDRWLLYRDPAGAPFEVPAGTVVRYGQDWGVLRKDRSVGQRELSVGGERYAHGLGSHAHSLIQLRPKATGRLRGGCGFDVQASTDRSAVCSVLDHRENVLFAATVRVGAKVATFDVPVRAGEMVYLKAVMADYKGGRAHQVKGAPIDWVDLEVED
jgi:hypothetical protein